MSELALTAGLLHVPIMQRDGHMALPWQQFLRDLYTRVGGGSAATNDEIEAESELELGAQTSSHLAALQAQIDAFVVSLTEVRSVVDASPFADLAGWGPIHRQELFSAEPWAWPHMSSESLGTTPVTLDRMVDDFTLGGDPYP